MNLLPSANSLICRDMGLSTAAMAVYSHGVSGPFDGLERALLQWRGGRQESRATVAAAAKTSESSLVRWESGARRPSVDELGRLLDHYGKTLRDLVDELDKI